MFLVCVVMVSWFSVLMLVVLIVLFCSVGSWVVLLSIRYVMLFRCGCVFYYFGLWVNMICCVVWFRVDMMNGFVDGLGLLS